MKGPRRIPPGGSRGMVPIVSVGIGALVLMVLPLNAHAQFLEKFGNPKVKVTVKHPPKLALKGTTRIAVSDLQGECGTELADRLTSALVESQRFEVLDRANLQAILREHNFNFSGMVDTGTAAKLGQILGTAALITGHTTRCSVTNDVLHGRSKERLLSKSQPVLINRVRSYISASLQLVELSSARIYSAKVFEGKNEESYESPSGVPETPDKNAALSKAYDDVVQQFTKIILPWSETVELTIYDDKDWGLKLGAGHIKLGEFDKAAEVFQQAIDANGLKPDADRKMLSKAYYNLGLALMYSERPKDAAPILSKSLAIRQTDIVQQALETCKRMIALDEQAQLKEASAIALSGAVETPKSARCAYCNEPLPPNAKFCAKCGRKVEAANACVKCGAKIPGGAKFCPSCGAPVKP